MFFSSCYTTWQASANYDLSLEHPLVQPSTPCLSHCVRHLTMIVFANRWMECRSTQFPSWRSIRHGYLGPSHSSSFSPFWAPQGIFFKLSGPFPTSFLKRLLRRRFYRFLSRSLSLFSLEPCHPSFIILYECIGIGACNSNLVLLYDESIFNDQSTIFCLCQHEPSTSLMSRNANCISIFCSNLYCFHFLFWRPIQLPTKIHSFHESH